MAWSKPDTFEMATHTVEMMQRTEKETEVLPLGSAIWVLCALCIRLVEGHALSQGKKSGKGAKIVPSKTKSIVKRVAEARAKANAGISSHFAVCSAREKFGM